MVYNNIFIKYKLNTSLKKAVSIFKKLQMEQISPIKYNVVQMIRCTETDIENILRSGQLSPAYNGYLSISQNGVWGCIALYSDSLMMLLYTSGHQTPLYFSLICDPEFILRLKRHYNDQFHAE